MAATSGFGAAMTASVRRRPELRCQRVGVAYASGLDRQKTFCGHASYFGLPGNVVYLTHHDGGDTEIFTTTLREMVDTLRRS